MPKFKSRVFLDTNVIFSGLYSAKGAPGAILGLFIEGRIGVVISQQVLAEVIQTLKEKLPEALPALKTFLVNAPPEIVPDPSPGTIQSWTPEIQRADASILVAAMSAKPDYFVTGDNHFLGNPTLIIKSGLNIVEPAQFLKLLGLKRNTNLN